MIAGSVLVFSSVNDQHRLLDLDEAAWTFDRYFFDLYSSGDWDPEKWHEFDKYAQHPPVGMYLFGALGHAIGGPPASVEHKRFWYEADLRVPFDKAGVVSDLQSRLTYKQVLAGRHMAAAFAALSAILLFFLVRIFAGNVTAAVAYAIFVTHPIFLQVAELATPDSFLLALHILVFLVAVVCFRSFKGHSRRGLALFLPLAILLGLSFATKISAYAWIPPLLLCALIVPNSRSGILRSLALLVGAVLLGFGVACLLDPGLHGSPLTHLFSRFVQRIDRVEIQQVIFAAQSLASHFDRFCFFMGHLFFSNAMASAIFLPLFVVGLISPFFGTYGFASRRMRVLGVALGIVSIAMTYATMPMAWGRYIVTCLPFLLLVAALGLDLIIALVRDWATVGKGVRWAIFVVLLLVATMAAATKQDLGPRYCRVPRQPSPEKVFVSKVYSFSLMFPGKSRGAHEYMYDYFLEHSDEKRARREKEILSDLKKQP